jgi:hypothetical protein
MYMICVYMCVWGDWASPRHRKYMHTYLLHTYPTQNHHRPTYALDFLLLHCYDAFKKEGLEFLSLSIAPLYGIGKDARDSRMLRGVFRCVSFVFGGMDVHVHVHAWIRGMDPRRLQVRGVWLLCWDVHTCMHACMDARPVT